MAGQQLRDEADPQDVGVAVLPGEPEALAEVGADDVAVEMVDEDAAPLELGADDLGDRALAGTGQSGEPECESMVFLWHLWRSFRSCTVWRFVAPQLPWRPHSTLPVPFQRPVRSSPPSSTALVQGTQPIDGNPWSCNGL